MISISVLSTQYVQLPVTATLDGAPYNPAGDPVSFAFTPVGRKPAAGDWNGGTWVTLPSGAYMAQILVGPANFGIALPVGSYQIWLRVTDNPEVPVQPADELRIY